MGTAVKEILTAEFPVLDIDVLQYIDSILENGLEDFEDVDDVYEALGEIFHDVSSGKSEQDIRNICRMIYCSISPNGGISDPTLDEKEKRVLAAPVELGRMADQFEDSMKVTQSIWVTHKDDSLKVNAKKLEKAEAKIQQKLEKREKDSKPVIVRPELMTASVSQVSVDGMP